MELEKISTEDLLAELKTRDEKVQKKGIRLVFGVICSAAGRDVIEMFQIIESEKDLNFMQGLKLRARFNSHRNYRGFYFKTEDFERLDTHCRIDNAGFAKWVKETESVKIFKL